MKMKNLITICLCAVTLAGCDSDSGKTTRDEMQQTEINHAKLVKAVPPPHLETSQERKNLVKRLERFNNENKVSYIYLVNYGKVMAFYTIKGKVSSVNSLLTTPEQLISINVGGANRVSGKIVSPDLDGSYGSNGDAIFFFTTDDTYVEWAGDYMLCDKPLKLTTPPQMVVVSNE